VATRARPRADERPLIAHVVYRFAVGGLENGVVNLINRLPADRWRHAVVSLTDVDAEFARRVRFPDVAFVALDKAPGHGVWQYPALWRTFRVLRPAIVHTRNLAALEAQFPAWASGVRARVHGEHGRDVEDLDGSSRRHILARRLYRPFVHRYVALSRDLAEYLQQRVGVASGRLSQIYNGVDTERFAPAAQRQPIPGSPFDDPHLWLVGTVGRMQTVKAQPLLVRAFVCALERAPDLRARLRLVLVGEGPLRSECEAIVTEAGLSSHAWLAGERADVPAIMRGLNAFALPSLAEGISNTILEAMASGLPVLATDVGGNRELVDDGKSGLLVPADDVDALADGLIRLAEASALARDMGRAGRERAERQFSLDAMVSAYEAMYVDVLSRSGT